MGRLDSYNTSVGLLCVQICSVVNKFVFQLLRFLKIFNSLGMNMMPSKDEMASLR